MLAVLKSPASDLLSAFFMTLQTALLKSRMSLNDEVVCRDEDMTWQKTKHVGMIF